MTTEELLVLLKDCHGVIDALMARLIVADRNFMPSKSPYWPVIERLARALEEHGKL